MKKKLGLESIEQEFNAVKTKTKKNHPLLFIILLISFTYIAFFGGAFLHESKVIQKFNIFFILFGEKKVEIDFQPYPVISENDTEIPFYIRNIGDRNIGKVSMTYTFCGLDETKVKLDRNKLYKEDQIQFSIKTPLLLNTSCQAYTNKLQVNVYEDQLKNCYLDVPDDITKGYCSFCKVKFNIFLDGKEQNEELWYPYLGDDINSGELLRNVLVNYPLEITWAENYSSQCKVLVPNTNKQGLIKKSPIWIWSIDTYIMCERGDDVEWCKENYYKK